MIMNRLKKLILVTFLLPAAFFQVQAEGSRWDISVAFIGPADPIYSWWGHAAIIVEDNITGESGYYDYGNFSFDQDSFANNFIMGRLYFLKMVTNPAPQLRYAAFLNRDVTLYNLNIPDDRKAEIVSLLKNDVRPENRVYLYDHFYDNCSTRIRDVLDAASGGALSEAGKAPSGSTLRRQARRFTYFNPLIDWLFNFAMKGNIDSPASIWDTMFLPANLEKAVATLMITDEDGTKVPFASNKTILSRAEKRPVIPETPRPRWYFGLAAGILLAAVIFLMKRKFTKSPGGSVAAGRGIGAVSAALTLVLGTAGTLLFFMACFTDHSFAYWNMNLLFINPFLLVTFGVSIRLLIRGDRGMKSLELCWTLTAAGILLSVLLKIIPFCRQDNWNSLLLMLPPALALGGFLRKMSPIKVINMHFAKKKL